ncbi:uncharacterized protein BO96DRAFT_433903 [Aspergillus niger CBS 101883]|uniref:uncharacterized protein n=1 Tax=Aspergillus lacticoffeatus (strain CBS 101883) TaxID=1450533 RepID=UPI000D7ED8B1|nr:uncharacterized protein BO96DRAFT_433903 [Aspergillus niger CBS 101883]PYH57122.1 hypothetical protein BO96DRAFT_433903 [Aspergillus niger CBS 101883]
MKGPDRPVHLATPCREQFRLSQGLSFSCKTRHRSRDRLVICLRERERKLILRPAVPESSTVYCAGMLTRQIFCMHVTAADGLITPRHTLSPADPSLYLCRGGTFASRCILRMSSARIDWGEPRRSEMPVVSNFTAKVASRWCVVVSPRPDQRTGQDKQGLAEGASGEIVRWKGVTGPIESRGQRRGVRGLWMHQRQTAKRRGGCHSHRQPDRPPGSANRWPLSASLSRAWNPYCSPPTGSGKKGGCHPPFCRDGLQQVTLLVSISPGRSGGLAVSLPIPVCLRLVTRHLPVCGILYPLPLYLRVPYP